MSVAPAPPADARPSPFTVRVKCTHKNDHPAIMTDITFKAYNSQLRCVAKLYARQIDREPSRVRGDFLRVMDMTELPTLAQVLFDKFGRLKNEHVENDYHKGTGVWGHELDGGLLIHVMNIHVEPEVSIVVNSLKRSFMLYGTRSSGEWESHPSSFIPSLAMRLKALLLRPGRHGWKGKNGVF